MQAHLVIVGTSVLRNALQRAQRGAHDGCSWPGDRCLELLASCADPRRLDRGKCAELRRDSRCWSYVECLVKSDPYGMSAELNAMEWVLGSGCAGVGRIVLYASDTLEGRYAAEILRGFLTGKCRGAEVSERMVSGLGTDFWRGLINIVEAITSDVKELAREGYTVYLNATGGFKPEAGIALLAASLAGPIAAYYKHESMREAVMLPLIPLNVDKGRVLAIVAKLEYLAHHKPKIRLDDPQLVEVQWILYFLAQSGALESLGEGYYKVTDCAAEILTLVSKLYLGML
ncbi:putative CRISPR-associated protein [Hyperthermus butylicus]|uniref:CRISPR system ring nuclease SSO1393-like domain-containing protein n=1 Tax=Hyperthermus butylicus (strain DSM 5456 / JCM 9403 / PLM1-5) TaxID=415426 RepID=A2BKV7_HYPBU|nr:putative CRISPR-associated protein [Hyperthermus butylicus]ABM80618.1 hypothetical protein Hbut_0764 [Hyperthermus butylicus DSM 5456]